MKLKYFLFGFFSMFIVFVLGFFLFYTFYIQPEQKEVFHQVMTEDTQSMEVSIENIPEIALANLEIVNLQNPEKGFQPTEKRFLFINFWATWCKPCIAELPELEALSQNPEIKNLPIQFVFASNEENKKILEFIKAKGFELPFYKYEQGQLPAKLTHKSIPVTFIIDTQTSIAYKAEGLRNWNSQFIIDFLNALNS